MRRARGELVPDARVAFPRSRMACECRIDWYLAHGFLTSDQARAGLRYRSLFRQASLPQRLTAIYAERVRSRPPEIGDARVQALSQLRAAARLLDAAAASAVTQVCGLDEYAGTKRTSDLARGLELLALHWGYRT